MRRVAVLSVVVVLALSCGCAHYFHDRALDAADMFGAKVIAGNGAKIGFDMRLTQGPSSLTPGLEFGFYNYKKYGFQGRALGIWEEKGYDFLFPFDREQKAIKGNKFFFECVDEWKKITADYQAGGPEVFFPFPGWPVTPVVTAVQSGNEYFVYPHYYYHHGMDLQLTVVPAFFGLELSISPYQIADFLTGWLYLDIAQDDYRNRIKRKK